MTVICAHRRQWLIAREDRVPGLPDRFQVRKLGESLFLHHDPELVIDGTDSDILTLGVLVGDASRTPAELRHHHPGRFVTIADGSLFLDATGSMAVFYPQQRGPIVCSSSVALIVAASGAPTLPRKLEWIGKSMNWDPSPSCRAVGFSRLFSDQSLDLASGRTEHRPRPLTRMVSDPANLLAGYLARFMESLKAVSAPIYLPLTGGQDSRTLLAAALAQGTEFTAYTDLRGKRSVVDDYIARRLARRYGFRHISDWPGKNDVAGSRAYAAHTAGCEGDSIAVQVASRFYDHFPPGAVTLSGGVFEVGRRFYQKRLAAIDFDQPKSAAESIAAIFLTDDRSVVEAIERWIHYRNQHPVAGMDLIELFYLDQRLGGWAAANRQAEDSTGMVRLTPMNSWEAISILLSVPAEERLGTTMQLGAMEQLVPGISTAEKLNPRFPQNLAAKIAFRGRAAFRGQPRLRI